MDIVQDLFRTGIPYVVQSIQHALRAVHIVVNVGSFGDSVRIDKELVARLDFDSEQIVEVVNELVTYDKIYMSKYGKLKING